MQANKDTQMNDIKKPIKANGKIRQHSTTKQRVPYTRTPDDGSVEKTTTLCGPAKTGNLVLFEREVIIC